MQNGNNKIESLGKLSRFIHETSSIKSNKYVCVIYYADLVSLYGEIFYNQKIDLLRK